jgi:NAD(P)-dependent dehydrogenase (short-subunit alcohol dehydrogenase family)
MRFTGKAFIVSGAASGIGKAVADRLVREGAHVAGIDVSPATLNDPAYRHVQADVRDEAAIEQGVEQVAEGILFVDGGFSRSR